jgi:hypothetical protein
MVSSLTILRNFSSTLITGFKSLKSHLAPLKLPAVATNTKRAYYSVMRRGARTQHGSDRAGDEVASLGSSAINTLGLPSYTTCGTGLPKHSIANSDTAAHTLFPLPTCALHTHPPLELCFGGVQQDVVDDARCIHDHDSGLLEKLHMTLLDLVDEYGVFDLNQLALSAPTSFGTVVYVEPVVESVMDSDLNDGENKGVGEDSGDNMPLEVVKYDLQHRWRRPPYPKSEIEIVPEDRSIGSRSYQVYPRYDGFRNDVQRRSDNIQMLARLHAVQQLTTQPVRQDEQPEPIGKSRPSVLSGLGQSSPLRNGWTMDDI